MRDDNYIDITMLHPDVREAIFFIKDFEFKFAMERQVNWKIENLMKMDDAESFEFISIANQLKIINWISKIYLPKRSLMSRFKEFKEIHTLWG